MYRQESKEQLLKESGAIKMTMMDKKELMFEETSSIVGGHAVDPVSGTGPLQETGPLKYETGPLTTCDPPKGTGPLGAVGPVNDWRADHVKETGPFGTGPLGYVDYPYQKKNTAVAYPY